MITQTNETGATAGLFTQLPSQIGDPDAANETHDGDGSNANPNDDDADMSVTNESPLPCATRPPSGGQPATAATARPNSNQRKINKMKLSDLLANCRSAWPTIESQGPSLQNLMVAKMKTMLGHVGEITRKSDGIHLNDNATYRDKHDLDSEGNPKEKQFVHSSVRIKPLLGDSKKKIKEDPRVADIAKVIALEQEKGIRLLDELKIELTKSIKKINWEEVKAEARMCAYDYCELAFETAGVLLIRKNKPNSGFSRAKTKQTLLLHYVVCSHLRRAGEEYLGDLPFHVIERGDAANMTVHAICLYMKANSLKNGGNPPGIGMRNSTKLTKL